MGLFVRIQQSALADGSWQKLLFVGEIFSTKAACVTDCILSDKARTREFARLIDYGQWTESGVALLLRLLRQSGPLPGLSGEAAGKITVALTDDAAGRVTMQLKNRVFAFPGMRELLSIDTHPGWLDCTLLSPQALAAGKHVPVSCPVSVQDAICAGLAGAFGWKRLEQRARRPLSAVEIRQAGNGKEYVLLKDVPRLPREYLRRYLSLSRHARDVEATDWYSFLHTLSRESDIPSAGPIASARELTS